MATRQSTDPEGVKAAVLRSCLPPIPALITTWSIANQEKHHHKKSFRQELEEMLKRAGIEYDPQYLD